MRVLADEGTPHVYTMTTKQDGVVIAKVAVRCTCSIGSDHETVLGD